MGAHQKRIGKQFEKDTQDIFNVFKQKYKFTYVRLYDTTSAQGKYIPAQPGDFIVQAGKHAHLIENKASEKHTSLRSCLSSMVESEQAASHRLWHRAGGRCWFLFFSITTQSIEVWDGRLVGECRAKGSPLPVGGYAMQVPFSLYQKALQELFAL